MRREILSQKLINKQNKYIGQERWLSGSMYNYSGVQFLGSQPSTFQLQGIQHLWLQGTPAHMCTYSYKHNFKIIELNLFKLRLMWYLYETDL